jgi:tetratricopeptide (TPR) repeat protein
MRQNVVGKLLRRLIGDFEKPKYKAILEKREIKGWRTHILVNLAKAREQYLSIQTEDVILLLRATGKIKQGQLVSATNYDLFINTGDVLAALGRPEDAIKDYDKAILRLSEPDKLKAAWNNKGLCFAGLEKYDEAIHCYDEALKIDPLLKEAWYNKGRAIALKGDHKTAIENYSKALEIDPDYEDALTWMEESRRLLK